jgi:signal transduction histidine kinase
MLCGNFKLLIEQFTQETVITVQDSRQGISPEHLAFLGQRFYRAGAKDNIAGHGGKMEIESTLNVRTTVLELLFV